MAEHEACCTPAPPSVHKSEGAFETVAGLKSYVNKPESAKKAIILAPDVFGFDAPQVLKLADKVAAAGYYVIVPDFLKGDPFVVTDPDNPFSTFAGWLEKHHPLASVDVTKEIIAELKKAGYESFGISGFCWGAKLAITLGGDKSVNSVVLLHPSLTTDEDVESTKVATSILASEIDNFTPPAKAEEFKKILAAKPFPSFVKVFPGMAHGWTIRYDAKVPEQLKAAMEAQQDMLDFYAKTL